MNIADLFKKEHTVFSFEVFPPKKESGIETIYSTLNELKNLNPDFISVTYGAGGKGVANATTIDLCSYIKNELGTETIAHLSCLYNTKESIDRILDELDEKGVKNILALRGDVNPDFAIEKDFKYASDLTAYIMSKNRGFNISGACYPEVHQEAANMIEDIQNLKKKVDSGADHLISQLFFDNQVFFDFQEKARIAGINVPIEAGIMPVTNKKQIERMVSMCGASIPAKLSKVLQRFGDNHEAMRDAGISYAIDQIIELAAHGVDGLIRKMQIRGMADAMFTDSLASAVIEQVCNKAEDEILKDFKEYEHTWRFGLGYGDFPLTGQKQFLDILDAGRRIGVCVNSGMTLVPTKSVTCIIGLGHNLEVSNVKSCDLCNFREKCTFRKDGKNCGK